LNIKALVRVPPPAASGDLDSAKRKIPAFLVPARVRYLADSVYRLRSEEEITRLARYILDGCTMAIHRFYFPHGSKTPLAARRSLGKVN